MREALKYVAVIAVAVCTMIAIGQVRQCAQGSVETSHVHAPADTNFVPIARRNFRPPSTPFELASKPPVRLPAGLREDAVKRAVRIIRRIPVGEDVVIDTTSIIETKEGQLFVAKLEGTETEVEEIQFIPPILNFGVFFSGGVALSRQEGRFTLSPSLATAPLRVFGVVQLPLVAVDLDGLGIGAGYRHGEFLIGAVRHWSYDGTGERLKIMFHYCL